MLGSTRRFPIQTRSFPSTPDGRSPAGAEIRYLIEGETGNMIHSTVPPGQVNRATVHATVSEFWHVLSGEGQIWRRDGTREETTVLGEAFPSTFPSGRHSSIDAPVSTRSSSSASQCRADPATTKRRSSRDRGNRLLPKVDDRVTTCGSLRRLLSISGCLPGSSGVSGRAAPPWLVEKEPD
jgi:mannose-6-phosphate isomerase-like protein (cupin superfamily)